VGMWESRSDFQGRWEGWKTCLWFSRLSTDRHFHGFPPLVCFGSFLLLLGSSAETIRFGASLKNVSTVGDAIEKRFAKPRIRNHLRPFRERQIRRENHGCFLSSLGHDLEQKLRADFRQRHVADFVDGDQIVSAPARHHSSQLQLVLGFDQFIHQAGCRGETDPALLPAGRYTEAGEQVSFTGAARARNIMPMVSRSSRFITRFTH